MREFIRGPYKVQNKDHCSGKKITFYITQDLLGEQQQHQSKPEKNNWQFAVL